MLLNIKNKMEPINYIDSGEDYFHSDAFTTIYKQMQDVLGVPAQMDGNPKNEVLTTDKSFEELKVLVGEIFAMGMQIAREKARFGNDEEAYKQWCKGKPQEHIEEMLLEIIGRITKLFQKEEKTLKKTGVAQKTVTPKNPYKDARQYPVYPNPYKLPFDTKKVIWVELIEKQKSKKEAELEKQRAVNEVYKNKNKYL